jgi:hypothetical protein
VKDWLGARDSPSSDDVVRGHQHDVCSSLGASGSV